MAALRVMPEARASRWRRAEAGSAYPSATSRSRAAPALNLMSPGPSWATASSSGR